jgi:hypothetical protein
MGDTTRHQKNTRAVELEPASLRRHILEARITSSRKLQLYAPLGKIGGVEGVEGSQRAVEIMIIVGFLTSS